MGNLQWGGLSWGGVEEQLPPVSNGSGAQTGDWSFRGKGRALLLARKPWDRRAQSTGRAKSWLRRLNWRENGKGESRRGVHLAAPHGVGHRKAPHGVVSGKGGKPGHLLLWNDDTSCVMIRQQRGLSRCRATRLATSAVRQERRQQLGLAWGQWRWRAEADMS